LFRYKKTEKVLPPKTSTIRKTSNRSAQEPGEHHEVQDNVVSGAMASTNHSTEELGAHHEVEDNEEEITNDVGVAMQSSSEISRPPHNISTQVRVFCQVASVLT